MTLRLTFLGTGTSHGVPSIDCMIQGYANCPLNVCCEAAHDPKHVRTRASLLVEYNDKTVLVDTSQDFREQMLRERVAHLDAVVFTHGHADHIYGFPDLRSYSTQQRAPVDCYASETTRRMLESTFSYVFHPPANPGGGVADVRMRDITGPFDLLGVRWSPFEIPHSSVETLAYRLGNIVYMPDVKSVPPDVEREHLRGVELLIVDGLRERPHGTHMHLEESLALVARVRPQKALFTHMTHDVHYIETREKLGFPEHVDFAYDGLVVELGR